MYYKPQSFGCIYLVLSILKKAMGNVIAITMALYCSVLHCSIYFPNEYHKIRKAIKVQGTLKISSTITGSTACILGNFRSYIEMIVLSCFDNAITLYDNKNHLRT